MKKRGSHCALPLSSEWSQTARRSPPGFSGEAFRYATSGETIALASDFLSLLLGMPTEYWTFDQVVYSISRD